jgi:signal transduction histidine kinase
LTAARLALANAEYLLPAGTDAHCTAALSVAKQSLDAASLASRRVVENLHAPALDAGIVCALSQWTESFAARTRLRTSVFCDADVRLTRLPHPALLAIFRVAQEALSNVAKHAGASSADVRIETDHQHLTVIVKDDGRGIGHPRHTAGRSFGIAGMRARCEAFGGTLRVASTKPHGTTLRARFAWLSMLAGGPSYCGAPLS